MVTVSQMCQIYIFPNKSIGDVYFTLIPSNDTLRLYHARIVPHCNGIGIQMTTKWDMAHDKSYLF